MHRRQQPLDAWGQVNATDSGPDLNPGRNYVIPSARHARPGAQRDARGGAQVQHSLHETAEQHDREGPLTSDVCTTDMLLWHAVPVQRPHCYTQSFEQHRRPSHPQACVQRQRPGQPSRQAGAEQSAVARTARGKQDSETLFASMDSFRGQGKARSKQPQPQPQPQPAAPPPQVRMLCALTDELYCSRHACRCAEQAVKTPAELASGYLAPEPAHSSLLGTGAAAARGCRAGGDPGQAAQGQQSRRSREAQHLPAAPTA